MKKFLFLLSLGLIVNNNALLCEEKNNDVTFEIRAQEGQQLAKMQLLIGVIGSDSTLQSIAQLLAQDLSCSLQKKTGFDVNIRSFEKRPTHNQIYQVFIHEGYPLILFLNSLPTSSFEWRLYDALQVTMLKGNRVHYSTTKFNDSVHACADIIWKELTGQEGIFSTIVAYCKQFQTGKDQIRHIFTQHLGTGELSCLVDTASHKLALRWHSSRSEPILFYSEQTPVNVCLLSTPYLKDSKKSGQKLVANSDGLNLQPSFSQDGKRTVMCSSCLGSSQLYYGTLNEKDKNWKFQRITYNNGNNISPVLRDNGDIIFCSDFEFHRPQIYYYHANNSSLERLTSGSYSASPAWCEQKQMLAYIKNVKGVMQLWVYDRSKKVHTQLTTDMAHKEEPTWSPEGTYIAFSAAQGTNNRIVVRNLITQEDFYLTNFKDYCCYPAWSPRITI